MESEPREIQEPSGSEGAARWGWRTGVNELMRKLEVPHERSSDLTILMNPDLGPMPPSRREWGYFSFFGYWGAPNTTIWTWSTGSAILGLGLNIQHTMGTITLGNIILCAYTCLNSGPGSKYHIGYTVCQRMIFGIYGSFIGIVVRIVLSIVFYASQSWLGGMSCVVILSSLSKDFMNMTNSFSESVAMTERDFMGFLIFQIIQLFFFFMKPEKMNTYINISCGLTCVSFMGILITCLAKNGGPGSLYHEPVKLDPCQTAWMWLSGITVWYGALSPDCSNQSDFSRFASSNKKMHAGIISAIMTTGSFVPLAGLICASATADLYGKVFWLPTDIVLKWLSDDFSPGCRAAGFFLGITFAASQLTFNVTANGFAGGMALSGIWPKYLNIKRGAFITAILSWVVQPWNFYNTSSVFMSVMSSFGVIVTPIIGILISDYYIVRSSKLPLMDLYSTSPKGAFYFTKGFNIRAIVVWLVTVIPGIPGLISSANGAKIPTELKNFFYGDSIFAFFISFVLHCIVCYIFPVSNEPGEKKIDLFDAFTLEECKRLDLIPANANDSISDAELGVLSPVKPPGIKSYDTLLEG